VCLHANASSSAQWRDLMDRLAAKFHVLAPDTWGAGKSPAWPAKHRLSLRDEVVFLEPVFARADEPVRLVGHSYGAAVALIAAIAMPRRVRSLALYEPTLFSLVDAERPPPNAANGIRAAVADAIAALAEGRPAAAAERFIDYWMGVGSWASMPEKRREPIMASIGNISSWAHALLSEPTPLTAFGALDIPVLYMVGTQSPASSRAVARVLARALPRAKLVELQGLGHMGPLTHPGMVNELIADFVETEAPDEVRPRADAAASASRDGLCPPSRLRT
jgi:pimeloyl-ACP methyl ester carboxylesterase